jgi:hypothetical protein
LNAEALVSDSVPVLVKLKLLPERVAVVPDALKVPELEITGAVPVAFSVLEVMVSVPPFVKVLGLPDKFMVALVMVMVPPLLLVMVELAPNVDDVPELKVMVPELLSAVEEPILNVADELASVMVPELLLVNEVNAVEILSENMEASSVILPLFTRIPVCGLFPCSSKAPVTVMVLPGPIVKVWPDETSTELQVAVPLPFQVKFEPVWS